jgi:hypothetical protein
LGNILLSETERVFIRQFNEETFSDRLGPALSWLHDNDLAPELMVAFQWALFPQGRLQPDSIDVTSCPIPFQPPWPSSEGFKVQLGSIVETYPWLKPYIQTCQEHPAQQLNGISDLTVEQIPMHRLIRGRSYVGRGVNGNVGRWDGQHFLIVAESRDRYVIKNEGYYSEAWGCFQPFLLIEEGRMVEPFGGVDTDPPYGRRMMFEPDGNRD